MLHPGSLTFKLLEAYGTRVRHPGQWRVHGQLRRWLDADVDADLPVVRDGKRWVLNPSDFVQADLFWSDAKDRWDVVNLLRHVHPGDVACDVGANFGYYALALAGVVGPTGAVHAFEPFPANLRRLRANLALNGLEHIVATHAIALSDAEGAARMTSRVDNSGAATLEGGSSNDGVAIATTTLDAFLHAHAIDRLHAVKVDIEGHEEHFLQGAAATLERHRPLIFIELDPPKLERAGTTVARLVHRLQGHGYALFQAKRGTLVPLRRLPEGSELVNAFAFHRDKLPS